MEITDIGLTPSHKIRLDADAATAEQQQFIDRLKSLIPEEEKQIHTRLDNYVGKLASPEVNFQIGKLPLEDADSYDDLLTSHPIESLHYFQFKIHSPGKKTSNQLEQQAQKKSGRYFQSQVENIELHLSESINSHLVYLGGLKQLYSAELRGTDDQIERFIIQGIIGLIHERIANYESNRLQGHAPQYISDESYRGSKPAEKGRQIPRKH